MMIKKMSMFNKKKAILGGNLLEMIVALLVIGAILAVVFRPTISSAGSVLSQQSLKSDLQRCKMEYDNAKERGDSEEELKKIDADGDGCHDALDHCIVDNSKRDFDTDGIADRCDLVEKSADNREDNKKVSQMRLCTRMGHLWVKEGSRCCAEIYTKEPKKSDFCEDAKSYGG